MAQAEQFTKATPEQVAENQKAKAARREAKKAKKEAKNKAFDVLKALVDKSGDAGAKAALSTIRPSLYGITPVGNAGGNSLATKFITLVSDKKNISEEEVFKALKIGRKDCAGLIRKHLKKTEPDNHVWINFDKDKGVYSFVGKGAQVPANYTGPKPSEEAKELK